MTDARSRDVLPIPDRPHVGLTTYDAKDPATSFPPIEPLRPPAGAPNVLVVLIDDAGFGSSSAFGGPCRTPTFERLAAKGLKYNRFHTTALCSPTRQALLTGRNHHAVGMGGITEIATSAPGYSSVRPNTAAPLAETLKLNGYSTAQFGKCHEVPVWETSPLGPFDSWPTGGGGFEHFYGFIGGETNQYAPAIYRDTVPVEPELTPDEGYHFTEDMTDKAIDWIRQQKALMADKPFFVYYAPGATHAPHHVPPEWSDRYKGEFDQGWDALREQTLARQKDLGVVPEDAELTARPAEIPAWDETPDDLKPVLARQMEVYAGFMEHTDHHVGRLIDALEELEILDDTLVYVIVGDNGASAEGTPNGCFNELIVLNGAGGLETVEFMTSRIDDFGTPRAYNHYAVGWAHAMDTPYQWTKQVASHWGGTRNGTIVHWPGGIDAKGEVRAAVPPRDRRRRDGARRGRVAGADVRERRPADAASRRLDAAVVRRRRGAGGARDAVLRDVLQPRHLPPGLDRLHPAQPPVGDDGAASIRRGRLGAVRARRLDAGPERRCRESRRCSRELQRLFLIEATKFDVLPLDDRRFERFNPDLAGRPQLVSGNRQILFGGMGRLTENSVVVTKNKSFALTAEVEVPDDGANGVIVAQGGAFGGMSIYATEGRPAFCYNLFGLQLFKVYGEEPLAPGDRQVRVEFAYDGGGLGKGGTASLYVDGEQVGETRVDATVPMLFSADETTDLGTDSATPVTDDLGPDELAFTGRVKWVEIDLGDDAEDADHLISPEERYRIAMARQ